MRGTATSGTSDSSLRLRTAAEVAELFQAKQSWIEEKARRREIPFTKISGSYRFSDRHVEEIIKIFERRPEEQQKRRPAPQRPPRGNNPTGDAPLQARAPRRRPRGGARPSARS